MSSEIADRARFAVDGVVPERLARPATVAELQEVLQHANDAGGVVVPWGGGTQMGFGNLPAEIAVAVDVTGLDRVVEYEPDDLTIGVQAGMTAAELDRILGEHGQFLPLECPEPEKATIGGLFATGIAGPRRLGFGSLRDLVLGISVVLPEGRLARGGGMVVKNVTGFDMMRLNYGALGSLGVIVQLNFKTLPRPRAQRTVLATYTSREAAFEAGMMVRVSTLGPSAIVLTDALNAGSGSPDRWSLAIRCEAAVNAVAQQAERVRAAVAKDAEVSILEDEETERLWSRIDQALAATPADDSLNVRIGDQPSALDRILVEVAEVVRERNLISGLTADIGSGLVYARLRGEVDSLAAAWGDLITVGAHSSLLSAPPAIKAGTDVFGRRTEGFPVMEALKEQFDPRRILNRGRFIGHL